MDMIKQYLRNPYIMAAVIGGGVFVGMGMFEPEFMKELGFTPINLGLMAALSYIAYLYWKGRIALPVLGRRSIGLPLSDLPPMPPPQMRAMTTSMADLLSPEQF